MHTPKEMGILSRFFHPRMAESEKTPQGSDWPLDDRAVLRHIARNDEDPDVRRAAEDLLQSTFGETLHS